MKIKYLLSAILLFCFVRMVLASPVPRFAVPEQVDSLTAFDVPAPTDSALPPRRHLAIADTTHMQSDTLTSGIAAGIVPADSLRMPADSLQQPSDSTRLDTARRSTYRKPTALLDQPITGKNTDSLVFYPKDKMAYIYNEGDINYQTSELKADYMKIDMNQKQVLAYGKPDSLDGKPIITKPQFLDGGTTYDMDTITYKFDTKKAMIKGVATQQGDGWLVGGQVKKMADNTSFIANGKYTTCDQTDDPHFYLALTRAKIIPGKKVVTGPAYMVVEDVPIYFLGIPEGFFPINNGPKAGLLMPTFGEERTRGFFLRDMGYYFVLGTHADLQLTGSWYTLGSWDVKAAARYVKRYKYNGQFNIDYENIKIGDKGDPDYSKQGQFSLDWTHTQDPKANPGSTFSASVHFATSGYSKYGAQTVNQAIASQNTNSTISYSKNWAGTPFSLSANMSFGTNSSGSGGGNVNITLPNIVFNVARIYPFKRKERVGKERWFEKISMQYTGTFKNSVTSPEKDMFSSEMFKKMQAGMQHTVPISATFNVLQYINVTPTINLTDLWLFKRQEYGYSPVTGKAYLKPVETGFFNTFNYTASVSATTTIYGMYDFTKKNKQRKLQGMRHMLTPTIGFSFAPDYTDPKYGYQLYHQTDSLGHTATYNPYGNNLNAFTPQAGARQMSLTFGLTQNLEIKVLSDKDTTGVKKIKLIDDFTIRSSYNFVAKWPTRALAPFSVSLRSTVIKNFGINLTATLDPYRLTPDGKYRNKLFFPGRLTQTGWSFGYTFKSRADNSQPAVNDITSIPPEYMNPYSDPYGTMDPVLRRQYMATAYYDFSIPWNFGFNYSINYSAQPVPDNPPKGYRGVLTQTVNFNGSINLTPKTGITFNGGFDFKSRTFTYPQIMITRDLHCWQMTFSWVPFGQMRQWSFHIGVKAGSLADLKYDKSQSHFDEMFQQ